MMEDIKRRLVRVVVPDLNLIETFTIGNESHFKCVRGLPVGAEYVNCFFDSDRMQYNFYFKHSSFNFVQPGDRIPELVITVERIKT